MISKLPFFIVIFAQNWLFHMENNSLLLCFDQITPKPNLSTNRTCKTTVFQEIWSCIIKKDTMHRFCNHQAIKSTFKLPHLRNILKIWPSQPHPTIKRTTVYRGVLHVKGITGKHSWARSPVTTNITVKWRCRLSGYFVDSIPSTLNLAA